LMDRQFDECPLTLSDLALIETAFVRVLQAIYHQRPTYPKRGKPHPADLSLPSEERQAVTGSGEQDSDSKRTVSGSSR
jgi:hypothetical protein